MPAEWKWYACVESESDECGYESDTREDAIAAIAADLGPCIVIEVCEAQMSTAKRYEGADFVPFTKVRNRERIELGPRHPTERPAR